MMKDDVVIVIPAYNPGECLKELINNLQKFNYSNIVVINDGSREEFIFRKLNKEVVILKHEINKGKGRALKTGFNYCIKKLNNVIGIITVDADGQHEIEDINRIYEEFQKRRKDLLLGSRYLKKTNVPFRSRIGNRIMSICFEKKMKIKIADTQTGLRAIPMQYIQEIEKVQGERFEYETNMLIYCINKKIDIVEIPIKTVYINKNKKSHFKILKDSIKIYKSMKNN